MKHIIIIVLSFFLCLYLGYNIEESIERTMVMTFFVTILWEVIRWSRKGGLNDPQ